MILEVVKQNKEDAISRNRIEELGFHGAGRYTFEQWNMWMKEKLVIDRSKELSHARHIVFGQIMRVLVEIHETRYMVTAWQLIRSTPFGVETEDWIDIVKA